METERNTQKAPACLWQPHTSAFPSSPSFGNILPLAKISVSPNTRVKRQRTNTLPITLAASRALGSAPCTALGISYRCLGACPLCFPIKIRDLSHHSNIFMTNCSRSGQASLYSQWKGPQLRTEGKWRAN